MSLTYPQPEPWAVLLAGAGFGATVNVACCLLGLAASDTDFG